MDTARASIRFRFYEGWGVNRFYRGVGTETGGLRNLRFTTRSAIYNGMSVTITLGKAGRLVVPKAIRDSLGLREGARLRLEVSAGKFEAIPQPDNVRITLKDGFPLIHGGPARRKGNAGQAIKADRAARTERILASRKNG